MKALRTLTTEYPAGRPPEGRPRMITVSISADNASELADAARELFEPRCYPIDKPAISEVLAKRSNDRQSPSSDISDLETCQIVDELGGRTGVQVSRIAPTATATFEVTGPATVLEVID